MFGLFVWLCLWHMEVLQPVIKTGHPSHCSDNTRSLTHGSTRELQETLMLYIFRCAYVGYINIYQYCMHLLDWPLYHRVMAFLGSYDSLCFKVDLPSGYRYCYLRFVLVSFAWNVFLHPFTFSLCVSLSESLVGNINMSLVVSSIHLLHIFWMVNLVHLHLK